MIEVIKLQLYEELYRSLLQKIQEKKLVGVRRKEKKRKRQKAASYPGYG